MIRVEMEIRSINIYDADERSLIDVLLQAAGIKSFTLRPGFLAAFGQTYDLPCHYLVVLQDGRCGAVAAFYERKRVWTVDVLAGIPGGFWAQDVASETAVIAALEAIARDQHLKGPFFKDLEWPLRSRKLDTGVRKAWRILPESEDALMRSHSKNIRRDIRKASRSGLTVGVSTDLEAFYGVWAQNMRDLGTPPVPKVFFANLQNYFCDEVTILLVMLTDHVIGGAFVFQNAAMAHDMYLSCLKRYSALCPNIFLYHEMFCWAIRRGVRLFDLGRSQPGSGNEVFKLRLGAQLSPLYNSFAHVDMASRPAEKLMTDLWKKMPLALSRRFGPVVRRFVPFG